MSNRLWLSSALGAVFILLGSTSLSTQVPRPTSGQGNGRALASGGAGRDARSRVALPRDIRAVLSRDPRAAARLIRARAQAEGRDPASRPTQAGPDFAVHVAKGSFAPRAGEHDLALDEPPGVRQGPDATHALYIVQFSRHVSIDESLLLVEVGGVPLDTVSDSAVVFLLPDDAVAYVAGLDFVRWVGAWRREHRARSQRLRGGRPLLYVYPFGPLEPEYLADLQRLGFAGASGIEAASLYVVPAPPGAPVDSLLDVWWIKAVERAGFEAVNQAPSRDPKTHPWFRPTDSRTMLSVARIHGEGIDGRGVTVGVRDDGVGRSGDSHPDLPVFDARSERNTKSNHGTHVTGILAGRGTWRGVAPDATVLVRELDDLGPADDLDVFRAAGVEVSNHSYSIFKPSLLGSGKECYTDYGSPDATFDRYAEEQQMLLVVAAGNEHGLGGSCSNQVDHVTAPASGKNVVTVGSVSYTFAQGWLSNEETLGGISAFSSVGPTPGTYHRLKPEMVAPGGAANFGYGVVAPYAGVPESDPAAVDPYDYVWPTDQSYTRMSGTSMAAPHVTGALALFRQKWDKTSFPAELAKAHLIASAIPLEGNAGPALIGYADTVYGYGLVNAFELVSERTGQWEWLLRRAGTLTEVAQQEESFRIRVPAGVRRIRAALAYNDTEGNAGNLNYDLDFRIDTPSLSYCADPDGSSPWQDCTVRTPFPHGVNTEGPVEKLVIDSPTTSDLGQDWTVRVRLTKTPASCGYGCVASRAYGLIMAADYALPSLAVTLPTSVVALPGQDANVPVTLHNTGGYIIPASGIEIFQLPMSIGGDPPQVAQFFGDLVGQGDSRPANVAIRAPNTPGDHTFMVVAQGVNQGLARVTRYVTVRVAVPQRLTVTRVGLGSGTVTSTLRPGISCGTDCDEDFPTGETVTLTATPAPGSVFAGWTGGGCSGFGDCTVTMTAATTVTAAFDVNRLPTTYAALWSQASPSGTKPGPRNQVATQYDRLHDRLIMSGGNIGGSVTNEVWVLQNAMQGGTAGVWQRLLPTGSLPADRQAHASVYDPVTNRLVIHGGWPGLTDTWALTNANGLGGTPAWTQLPSFPLSQVGCGTTGGLSGAAAAYDAAHNRLILFGGFVVSGYSDICASDQVWVLLDANGAGTPSWTKLAPGGTPPEGRTHARSVYDPASNRLIVFGGQTINRTYLGDVWVLTNANGLGGTPQWVQITPVSSASPTGRSLAMMDYDPSTKRAVVVAGYTATGALSREVWPLHGADGTTQSAAWILAARVGADFGGNDGAGFGCTSTLSRCVIALGGLGTGYRNDVWTVQLRNGVVRTRSDFDGDARSDLAVFRPTIGTWFEFLSGTGTARGLGWGAIGDTPVAADYDGDGQVDAAVFRPAAGTWYITRSATQSAVGVPWGEASDIPVPADYDGDGKADVAVFRPSLGRWLIVNSSSTAPIGIAWGAAGDIPLPADYDGDGRADVAVFRPSAGTWYIVNSTTSTAVGVPWGQQGDVPVPADFDGDGKADPTVFRPATGAWYQRRSATGSAFGFIWGQVGDTPIVGDYDGDGKADPTVFRDATGTWYQLRSTSGASGTVWGQRGDLPL